MIALGLTGHGGQVPASMTALSAGRLTLVAVERALAATARDRLVLQVQAMEALAAFLPLPVARASSVDLAHDWARAHEAEALAALERVEGNCQMVLDLRGELARTGDARSWLRHRSSMVTVPERLREHLAPMSRATGLRRSKTGAAIDLMIERRRVETFGAAVRLACDDIGLHGLSAVLVGPWPVMTFHGLESLL